jgi:alpha-L-glutamate ligase-like protein
MNRRNAEFILPHNPRRLYPLVDDKLKTKRLAEAAGLAVPELYGVIERAVDVRNFRDMVSAHEEFVVKPAQGSGGDGIVVVKGRVADYYRKASGDVISEPDMRFHLQNTLGGVFSLGGLPDKILIEYCVRFDPVFEKVAYQGVPDVRVIVFQGYPIMAMVRLPTRMSGGRANLHQGAIGAGVDIGTGRTLTAVWRNDIVREHPDTREPVSGVEVPHWTRILHMAAHTHELTGLGYQAVDIVLDENKGPLILEINARPGLNIQIANRSGLKPRVDAVHARLEHGRQEDRSQRVAFSREAFAA